MNSILATCTAVTILNALTCRVPTTANAWTATSARAMEMSINLIQGAVRIFFFIFTGHQVNGKGIVFSRVCPSVVILSRGGWSSYKGRHPVILLNPQPYRSHPWETFKLVQLELWGVLLRTISMLKKPMKWILHRGKGTLPLPCYRGHDPGDRVVMEPVVWRLSGLSKEVQGCCANLFTMNPVQLTSERMPFDWSLPVSCVSIGSI